LSKGGRENCKNSRPPAKYQPEDYAQINCDVRLVYVAALRLEMKLQFNRCRNSDQTPWYTYMEVCHAACTPRYERAMAGSICSAEVLDLPAYHLN